MSENELDQQKNNEMNEAATLIRNVSEATNGPKFGIFEQVLCSLIYQAANSPDPLRQVQLITDAALMLDGDKRKSLGVDTEKVLIIKSVTTAFLHSITTTTQHSLFKLVTVKFGFAPTEANFEKFIKPWYYEGSFHFYPQYVSGDIVIKYKVWICSNCHNEIADDRNGYTHITDKTCDYCGKNLKQDVYTNPQPFLCDFSVIKRENVSFVEYIFALFRALAEDGFVSLTNSFLEWSMPFILDLMRRLTEAVRPEIYSEVAKMFAEANRGGVEKSL